MDSIRVLHTSDWHLGRKLFKKDRTNEGEYYLNWLCETLKTKEIDLLIIAGDIFDVFNPPHNSIQVFYRFLKEVETLDIQVVIISGNHDSQTLIETGQIVLDPTKFHFKTKLHPNFEENIVRMKIKQRDVNVKCLPYFRNHELFNFNKENDVDGVDEFCALESFLKEDMSLSKEDINIFTGHHLFGDFSASGSEQVVSLSGIDSIPIKWIKDSHSYCALGHIHKYQNMTKDHSIAYCGSPYQMRFSEKTKKIVNILEYKSGNTPAITQEPVKLARSLIQVKTKVASYKEDIIAAVAEDTNELTPFLEVLLEVDRPIQEMADEIRQICVDAGGSLISFSPILKGSLIEDGEEINLSQINIIDMLDKFHQQKFDGNPISKDLLEKFNLLMDEIDHEI